MIGGGGRHEGLVIKPGKEGKTKENTIGKKVADSISGAEVFAFERKFHIRYN